MFDLARLRLLREFARRGTMTAEADAIGLTSSAVSQQLATLEREARVALLERVGRRVRMTAEGVRLAAHAEVILAMVEAAELDLLGASENPEGELQIACFSTYAKVHLVPAVMRLRRRFAHLHVVIRELESVDAIEAVRDGRCHLAVSFTYNLVPRPHVAGLVSRQLMEEPVLLVLPEAWGAAQGPIELKRLAEESWIVGSRQTDDRLLAERACATAGFAPRVTHTIDDYDLLLRMVSAGLGVGLVPAPALKCASAAAVTAHAPGGTPLSRHIHVWTRGTPSASPAIQSLLSELGNAPER